MAGLLREGNPRQKLGNALTQDFFPVQVLTTPHEKIEKMNKQMIPPLILVLSHIENPVKKR